MALLFPLVLGTVCLVIGMVAGYYTRQSIAKKRAGTIEQKLLKKINQAKKKKAKILEEAKNKAEQLKEKTESSLRRKQQELSKTQQLLLKKENILDKKSSQFKRKKRELGQKAAELQKMRKKLNEIKQKEQKELERVSGLSKQKAKKKLFKTLEDSFQKEIAQKEKKLEREGGQKLEKKAKKILSTVIQKCAVSHSQEITTDTVMLESEDFKGRIIGKEGRNIRAFEKLTGVELVVDESPEAVIVSSFNPVRRAIAKLALEKLIQDGRIQPARIEEKVTEAKKEIGGKIKEAGEKAVYETAVTGINDKLVELLGRLYFRTSFGQNVLLHSMEVSLLAEALAEEIGADNKVAKRAGLLHDIGKAVDHQVKGSHVDIGIKILEKFGESEEVINAMKSHHEEYPSETVEATLVATADAISGARPGARKDTLENYLQRLKELEDVANSFSKVDRAYAIQAGREVRVFVKSQEVSDLKIQSIARKIADKIEKELRYPGEIKISVIKENRVVEYAR